VAEKVPERIRRLVYLDAYIPQDNKSAFEYNTWSRNHIQGKSLEDFRLIKIAKEINLKPSLLIKFRFIEEQAKILIVVGIRCDYCQNKSDMIKKYTNSNR